MKKEIEYISHLISRYPRTDRQVNRPFESDAEIIQQKDGFLAVSVDAVSEELEMGLLQSPKTIGWMTVTASVSDIAAVGLKTEKVSVLFKESGKESQAKSTRDLFFEGVNEACLAYKISEKEVLQLCGYPLAVCTAYSWSPEQPKLHRQGLQAGDELYLTGPIGWGNAVAFANLAFKKSAPEVAQNLDMSYRPRARWEEALFVSEFASACIDTSDGFLSTVKWLEILNQKKIEIEYTKSLFHPVALQVAIQAQVNPWLFCAAQNGEFELLFSVPRAKKDQFLTKAKQQNLTFLPVGRVKEGSGISLCLERGSSIEEIPLELGGLLDMLQEGVDPEKYILAMLQFSASNGISLEEKKNG